MASRRLFAGAASLLLLGPASVLAQHDGITELEVHGGHEEADTEHSETVFRGGHVSGKKATEGCKPVVCDEELVLHDAKDAAGCQPLEMYNFIKDKMDPVNITCQGCIPHTCNHGEHDCVPVVCDVGGALEGGHSFDPCEQGHHGGDGLAWWPFMLCGLLITVMVTTCLKKLANGACCGKSINPPFTVVMFFLGYAISSFVMGTHHITEFVVETANEHLGFTEILIESVNTWKLAHPHIILFVLLPPLLFEDASGMDYYVFRKVLLSSVLLAGPGVAIGMLLVAGTTMLLFGFANECVIETDHVTHETQTVCGDQLSVSVHLLLGGMLAATDPVAVCAVLNDLGCPDKLNFMIAGESLLNDGTAVVVFLVMQSVAGGCSTDAAHVLLALVKLAGGGVLFGLFMAACAYQGIKKLRDPNIEITSLVFCTFATFWLAENIIGVSGVLGTVVFGVQTARTSMLAMDEHTHHANHAFWSELGYICTSFIFLLSGVKSRDKIARFLDEAATTIDIEADEQFHLGNQMTYNFLLWIIMTFIRAFVVLVLAPFLTRIGYGLTPKEAAVMVWGGLRGAISLSLALLVDGNHLIGDRAREMIFLQTVGIVTLTLVVNGTTSGMVYKALQVYPPNPFKPVLATQGLRNLQLEMERYITELNKHWFHKNADVPTVLRMFPNLSESYMFDGDLVDVKCENLHSVWQRGITGGATLSPMRMGIKAFEAVQSGVMLGLNAMRVGYEGLQLADEKDPLTPDSYAEIVLEKGETYQTFETSIVTKDANPTWEKGATATFNMPEGTRSKGSGTLYLHMFDNDLGELDRYIGEAKIPMDDILEAQTSVDSQTVELQAATHMVKLREYTGVMPTEVSGSIDVSIKCSGGLVTVTLLKAVGIGQTSTEGLHNIGDHEADGHGSHGHGGHHMMVLKNVKRWIMEANEEVDPTHAMYEILLSAMKSHFIHEREEKLVSVRSFGRLNSALGLGYDMNNEDMDALTRMEQLQGSGDIGSKRLAKQAIKDPSSFVTPIDSVINYLIDFADQGLPYGGHFLPSVWFQHRLTVAETFQSMLGILKDLADADPTELGEEFGNTLVASSDRLRTKLLGLQAEAPNTWKAAHTLLAFNAAAAEFGHRIHIYQDQGFFDESLVLAVQYAMESRQQEITQYIAMDYTTMILGLCSNNACDHDHPIVGTFMADKKGIKGHFGDSSELGLDKPESERTGEGGDEESAAEPEADADGEDDEDEEEDSDVEDDVEAK